MVLLPLHLYPRGKVASESHRVVMFSYFFSVHCFLVVAQCLDLDSMPNSQVSTFDLMPPKVCLSKVR